MRILRSAILLVTLLGVACAPAQPETPAQPLPNYPVQYHQLTIDLQPAGENGWDLLMQIAELHREVAERHWDEAYELHDRGYVAYELAWNPDHLDEEYSIDTQLPRIEAQIDDAYDSGLLDMLATLATKDNLVQPVEDTPLLDLTHPQLGVVRALARLNAARMTLAASSGDAAEFIAAAEQSIWLARHVAPSASVLIGQLVGIAVEALTLERIRAAILAGQITAPTAAALLAILDNQPPALDMQDVLRAEQLMRLDTIAGMYTDDESGGGLHPSKVQMVAREAEIAEDLIEIVVAMPQDRAALLVAFDDSLSSKLPFTPRRQANVLLGVLTPSIGRAAQTADQVTLELAATRIMLAIEVSRAQHGVPPDLDALVPEYLDEVPVDPFTRAPLLYRPAPETALGYVLYSAGYDKEDNHGFVSPDLQHPTNSLRQLGIGSDYPFVPMK